MSLSKKQVAILHVAKAKLGMSDASYRSTLAQLAGVETSTDLDQGGFEAVMGFFEYLGFAPTRASGPDYGRRPGMASFAQLELIRVLWHEYTEGRGTPDGLVKWVERCFHVASLRFLKAGDARKAIVALKSMKARKAA